MLILELINSKTEHRLRLNICHQAPIRLRVKHLMPHRRALWMIHGIVHNVTNEPPARAFLQVCTVQRTIRRIAIGSLSNSFDDVRGRALTVRHARSTQVVFGIGADAHRRKLVLSVNHFVQRLCNARGAALLEITWATAFIAACPSPRASV